MMTDPHATHATRRPIHTPLRLAAALLLMLAAFAAPAADEHNVAPGVTAAGAPLGLHGADPVTLVRERKVVAGQAVHTAVHDGVAYYLSSAANLAAFEAEPEAFVPQHGGFCTYGVAKGKKFDGDPQHSAIVNGKLYVFLNGDVLKAYAQDPQGTLSDAARNWPRIRTVAAAAL
jgi:YHS domain-containing protein